MSAAVPPGEKVRKKAFMDNDGNESILDTYLYETNTLLEQLDSIVLEAEQADTFSEGNVNEIFRIMHTIKGASAMMEYESLATVAHRIEDLFFIIREKGMDAVPEEAHPDLFEMMFQSIDFFRGEVEKIESGQPLSNDIDSFLQKINSVINKINGTAPAASATAAPVAAETGNSPIGGGFPYRVKVFFDEGAGMENLRAFMLVTEIRAMCPERDFTFFPSDVETNSATTDTILSEGFLLAFRRGEDREKAAKLAAASGSVGSYQTMDQQEREEKKPQRDDSTPEEEKRESGGNVPVKAAAAAAGQAAPQHAKESLISVSLSKLNQLMDVVGEIVITESMVTSSPDLKGLKLDRFTKSARQLRKLTDELQDVSMSLRMVPVLSTFQKMQRIVRDMGKKLGKSAKLTLVGAETEMDKSIVDSIGDPLMHIIRNSMDHGIEDTEAERVAAGKDSVGEIILSAMHTGEDVIIQVKDDGQGIDYDRVLQKAIKVGLANPEVEYSRKEILNFLLMPGFSTNSEVTEYSGRGVGMDVVKKAVEEVGGTVTLSSEQGRGMTTTLKIPLTMAIMDGMEVQVGGCIFTIPIINIRQSFKMSDTNVIHDTSGGEMVKIMDVFYPVVRVKQLYSIPEGAEKIEDGIVMWVESGECSYALFVDELIGEQQVVVKPLPNYINAFNMKQHGITGCTILGDGSISAILDVFNLYSAAL